LKKIAIIGPFNSRGGREIEAGFIATALSRQFETIIYSTESMDINNDIGNVNQSLLIYHRSKKKLSTYLSYLGYRPNRELHFKNLKSRAHKNLNQVIKDCDIVFIIAQLTSNYMSQIIRLAKDLDKDIFFRTTGTIPELRIRTSHFNFLKSVNLFINHSYQNSLIFDKVPEIQYTVIDQCNFNEETTLKACQIEKLQIKKFYCVARLDSNKGIGTIIKAFNKLSDRPDIELHIIGDGSEYDALKMMCANVNIIFHGHLKHEKMIKLIAQLDCLIVGSLEEAGPYSAIEAMSLGIPVISTPVGAMPERYSNEPDMWFSVNDVESLIDRIILFANKTQAEIALYKKRTLKRYSEKYTSNKIAQSYIDAVVSYLKQ
jgi:glycosyltransferase involved in cell wall biosynthesis